MAYDLDEYGVAEDGRNLVHLMDGVLERLEAIYLSYNVPLPTRRYWTMGTPAFDCEQATVSFIQMYLGAPGSQASIPQHCNAPRTAVLSISIVRPVPTLNSQGKFPAAEKIQNAAEISAVDAWILMDSVNLFDNWNNDGFGLGVIATMNAPAAAGGFTATEMQLVIAVP